MSNYFHWEDYTKESKEILIETSIKQLDAKEKAQKQCELKSLVEHKDLDYKESRWTWNPVRLEKRRLNQICNFWLYLACIWLVNQNLKAQEDI